MNCTDTIFAIPLDVELVVLMDKTGVVEFADYGATGDVEQDHAECLETGHLFDNVHYIKGDFEAENIHTLAGRFKMMVAANFKSGRYVPWVIIRDKNGKFICEGHVMSSNVLMAVADHGDEYCYLTVSDTGRWTAHVDVEV